MKTSTATPRRRPAPPRPVLPPDLAGARAAVRAQRAARMALLDHAWGWISGHLVDPAHIAGMPVAAGETVYPIDRPNFLHATAPVMGRDTPAALYGDQAVRVAGDGAPLVWAFGLDEFSAAVEMSPVAATALVGEVLDLTHRFPKT